jgi:serine/threonine protein kinase
MSDGGGVIPLYGITQEPHTKNYMMVLGYACNGNIRKFLKAIYDGECAWFRWYDRIQPLRQITRGLKKIHASEIIHRDLHIGNILHNGFGGIITDMGLCKPANYNTLETTKKSVYGVLPYIAPEILRGQDYTKAADIYSFGIIMYEVLSGLPPYHDVSHDEDLAIKICRGLRPRFNIKVPQTFVHLVKRCLDANPLKRPTAEELENLIEKWTDDILTHK